MIDNDLCSVRKITELGFPRDELILRDNGVAVFKTEHGVFGQRAVKNVRTSLRVGGVLEFVERCPAIAGHCVVHIGVALRERAAPRILTAKPDRIAVQHQRAHRHCLAKRPIHGHFAGAHFCTPCELADHLRVDVKFVRNERDLVGDLFQGGR